MRRSLVALALLAAACAAPDTGPAGSSGESAADTAPVVLDLDATQLEVERLDIDLDVTIARFLAPPDELPLERVFLSSDGQPAENLAGTIYSCFEDHEYELTNGDGFIVTSTEDGVTEPRGRDCLPCGLAFICPGLHKELGPGEAPPGDISSTDVDPPRDGDDCGTGDNTGGTTGGSTSGTSGSSTGGSSGGSSSSGSGTGTGGSGGSSGGAGNPGWG